MDTIFRIAGSFVDWLDKRLPGASRRHIGRVLEQRGL